MDDAISQPGNLAIKKEMQTMPQLNSFKWLKGELECSMSENH